MSGQMKPKQNNTICEIRLKDRGNEMRGWYIVGVLGSRLSLLPEIEDESVEEVDSSWRISRFDVVPARAAIYALAHPGIMFEGRAVISAAGNLGRDSAMSYAAGGRDSLAPKVASISPSPLGSIELDGSGLGGALVDGQSQGLGPESHRKGMIIRLSGVDKETVLVGESAVQTSAVVCV
ncbi:hypothetical protein NEOLI_004013 [Neolecta irregularis DAH-3]|uniref:Uncharacterized protein n=1 Tax=Neolecta irregularis (strain DAH-3) TaxID=1198029 RepID=A0A1U7LNZ7_NEOID|nr:hypothetical protein NEOLI_004013 [Neolecta irregularis DAH-3]|eukprot:OLL24313.1 hypothetical protein NEOLI_004013 [Neolecta irregularis DAH-3]